MSGRKSCKSVDETIKRYFTGSNKEIADKFADVMIEEVDKVTHTCERVLSKQTININEATMVLLELTPEIVRRIIKNRLKTDVSPGFDKISAREIQSNLDLLNSLITDLLNKSITQAMVPSEMKTSVLRPVYKKGKFDDFTNYRPVALQQTLFKILEFYISDSMDNFFDKHQVLIKQQYGYKKDTGTADLLDHFADLVNDALDNHLHVIVCFVDFSKAFDTLNHKILLNDLESLGVRGHVNKWFKSYLENRHYVVKIEDEYSEKKEIKRGVPQGSVLGPKLYVCYVNDISHCFLNCDFYLYADDLAIVSVHKNQEKAVGNLQLDFNTFQKWAHDKELTINTKKTEILHISSPNLERTGQIKIKTHSIECLHSQKDNSQDCTCETYLNQVKCFKYLGLYIDESFSWRTHIDKLCKKLSLCSMRLNNLKWYLPKNVLRLVYHALAVSLINYGITVWGQASETHIEKVQKLQNRCVRAFSDGGQIEVKTEKLFKTFRLLKVRQICNIMLLKKYNISKYRRISKHGRNTRLQTKEFFFIPGFNNKYGQRKLKYIIPKILNSLPKFLLEISSSKMFNRKLKNWYLNI